MLRPPPQLTVSEWAYQHRMARVAAELAAELGVDAHRLQKLMDARLRQHLAERNDVRVAVA